MLPRDLQRYFNDRLIIRCHIDKLKDVPDVDAFYIEGLIYL